MNQANQTHPPEEPAKTEQHKLTVIAVGYCVALMLHDQMVRGYIDHQNAQAEREGARDLLPTEDWLKIREGAR